MVTKEEILNYATTTPENTNKNVLNSMLNDYSNNQENISPEQITLAVNNWLEKNVAAISPLILELASPITLESKMTPAVITKKVQLRGNYNVASINSAINSKRLVFCFTHIDILWYGEEQYSYDLALQGRIIINPEISPEEPYSEGESPVLSPLSIFVEFYGELPKSIEGSYPGGKIIIRSEEYDPDSKIFDVIYNQYAPNELNR